MYFCVPNHAGNRVCAGRKENSAERVRVRKMRIFPALLEEVFHGFELDAGADFAGKLRLLFP